MQVTYSQVASLQLDSSLRIPTNVFFVYDLGLSYVLITMGRFTLSNTRTSWLLDALLVSYSIFLIYFQHDIIEKTIFWIFTWYLSWNKLLDLSNLWSCSIYVCIVKWIRKLQYFFNLELPYNFFKFTTFIWKFFGIF